MEHPAPDAPASDPSQLPSIMLRVAIILGTPLLVLAFLFVRPRSVDLLIHNAHPVPVWFKVEGYDPGKASPRLDPHETRKLSLTAGPRALGYTIEDPAGPIQGELSADLRSAFAQTRSTYLWDLGRALKRAWVVHRGYGTSTAPRPERLALDEVTLLPRDVIAGLNEGFPDQIREKQGQTGGVRSALWTDRHADSIRPRQAAIFLDNRSQAELRLWLGDRLLGTAPALKILAVRVPAGVQRLRAVEVGAAETVISEHEVEVELEVPPLAPPPAFVWSPLSEALDFFILNRSYGDYDEEIPPLEPYTAPAAFFPVPAGLVPCLDAFPLEVDAPQGAKGALRRALFTPHGARAPR
jgi:hypothetical protein